METEAATTERVAIHVQRIAEYALIAETAAATTSRLAVHVQWIAELALIISKFGGPVTSTAITYFVTEVYTVQLDMAQTQTGSMLKIIAMFNVVGFAAAAWELAVEIMAAAIACNKF